MTRIRGDEVLGEVFDGHREKPFDDPRTDEELVRIWQGDETDDNGCAWTALYYRHRESVQQWLLDEGLTVHQVEAVIGDVIATALDSDAPDPLPERLRTAAAVAGQANRGRT